MSKAWWNRWPALFKTELKAFKRYGIEPRETFKDKGILILQVLWPVEGREPLQLCVGFSPLHPFFRPTVAAPEETFERHQNPLGKQLCLLTQESGQWDSRWQVADFINARLQHLLAALAARREGRWDDAAELEERAADPLMPYFADAAEDDSVILFDGATPVPQERHGLLDIKIWLRPSFKNDDAFEGVLSQVKTSGTRVLGNVFSLPVNSPEQQSISGRWLRMDPPATDDPDELLELAEQELERQAVLQARTVQPLRDMKSNSFMVTGIVFPEEVEYGSETLGIGWLFLVSRREFKDGGTGPARTTLVRGERAAKRDIFARLPVATALAEKNVVLMGCGAIGSFVGAELARAGVGKITLIDGDVVQPGNSLRWPLGRPVWGRKKASVLGEWIAQNYPWTKAAAYEGRIGSAIIDATKLPKDYLGTIDQLHELIEAANLVIDASASTEVQHAFSDLCQEMSKPYIMGYATLGVAGGLVARFTPGAKSCWVCLLEHWRDGSIPAPRVDEDGIVTPAGCNGPTFTGGGYDLQEVSLEMVRSAVGLLSDGAYDPGAWRVALLELKHENGQRALPRWTPHSCPPHPRCCGR